MKDMVENIIKFVRKAGTAVALVLLVFPIRSFKSFEERLLEAETALEGIQVFASVSAGLTMGFTGAIVLALVIDGAEFRPKWLLLSMIVLGGLWCFFHPQGWMVGAPLMVYGALRLFQSLSARHRQSPDGGQNGNISQ